MRKKMSIKSMLMAPMVILVVMATVSCDSEPDVEPMDLPPVESLMMDFSDFSEEPGQASGKGTINTYENFLYSYLTIGFWNISATLVSVLPVTAYAHALQQSPVYLGDNSWEWSFEFPLNNINYKAILTGARIDNEEFSVEMEIALAATPNLGAKWFDGVVRYDHTHATWTIFIDGDTPVLGIEWNKDFVTEVADLTYTYREPGHAENGSYIKWGYNPAEEYDGTYTVSLVAGLTNIEWNTTTIQGHVKASAKFGDDTWHCWDSHANGLMDISCE